LSASAQAKHTLAQSDSQHTPSTQKPLLHSLADVQV
jgi:hypothetical protein